MKILVLHEIETRSGYDGPFDGFSQTGDSTS
jgi:hypothetical protein